MRPLDSIPVVGSPITVGGWTGVLATLDDWIYEAVPGRYIAFCNVHSVITARSDPRLASAIRGADIAAPDGAPVALMVRLLSGHAQARINGPDFMLRACSLLKERGRSIFLYGGSPETLALLQRRLNQQFPGLVIAGAYSPPYRPLTSAEDSACVELINASGASVVWVGLGCPKQEIWMHEHKHVVRPIMLGVGAAFDYLAGTLERAPLWMQRSGLEWLFRLVKEPRRLWRRYLFTNCAFATHAMIQLAHLARRR